MVDTPRSQAHRRTRSLRGILAVALVVGGAILPARADLWYESYQKAETALEREEWAEAVQLLTDALERKGDSSPKVRTYGMNFIAYFPYLGLARAYRGMGQLDAALQALDTEERLGAIRESPKDLATLQSLRRSIQDAREAEAAAQRGRIQTIVADNLAAAREMEAQGRFEDAMSAISRALAVDEANEEARSAMSRVREAVARVEEEREIDARVADLVRNGKAQLDQGNFQEASTFFTRALSARSDDSEARSLLERAQSRLRAERFLTKESPASTIASELNAIVELESAGRLVEALNHVQTVLALEPSHEEALRMRDRLLEAQAAIEEKGARDRTLRDLLAQAEQAVGAGDYEDTLAIGNRILALDPGNAAARGYISRAFTNLNAALLGSKPVQNIPPAIRFADFREQIVAPDGSLDVEAEITSSPSFRLSGSVIDTEPVDIRLLGPEGQPVEQLVQRGSVLQENLVLTEFTAQVRLEPGDTTFTVVASDAEGLPSRGEYTVRYLQPFWRTSAFAAGVASIAVLGAASLWGLRLRRRRRLLKRQFNPYVAGSPVFQEDLFFGRETLINHVLQRIHNNSVLLYGERRIGKTSIQHRLKKRIAELDDPRYAFFPVFCDLQGTPQERFFATLAEETFLELRPRLDGLEPDPRIAEGAAYDYRVFQRDLQRILKALRSTTDKHVKLVLLIDEVDELNAYDPRINQKLRSLFMRSFAEHLVAVVSGVAIKKHWELEGSPWYNFFQEIEVTSFRKEDAVDLIERPLQGMLTLEKGVVDRVIEATGCKPYLIQKICASLVNSAHEHRRRKITLADVASTLQREGI